MVTRDPNVDDTNEGGQRNPSGPLSARAGSLTMSVSPGGVATVVFDRPPVNAVSLQVYEDIGKLTDVIRKSEDIRVVVLTAPDEARAWCGGADVKDFVGMDSRKRKERYEVINEHLTGFYHLSRPVIAAINSHAIGIGMVLAGLCDMRVTSEDAFFSCPEIDYGLIAGGAGLFSWLKMPEAKVREILFTGRRFSAAELEPTGFFNYVVPRDDVFAKTWSIAELIAEKSLPVIEERKARSNALEGMTWMEAYLDAQRASGRLVELRDAQEGVRAFLEHREADYRDG